MGTNKVIISDLLLKEVIEHARIHLPYESCGLLAGTNNIISSFWKLENEVKSENRFFVQKKVVEKTFSNIEERSECVIAIYHSHPTTAPIPSSYDIFSHPDQKVKMVIVSFKLEIPKIQCYNILKSTYFECPIVVETVS